MVGDSNSTDRGAGLTECYYPVTSHPLGFVFNDDEIVEQSIFLTCCGINILPLMTAREVTGVLGCP